MEAKIVVALVDKINFLRENESNTVFINHLPENTSDKSLYEAYSEYGKIQLCEVCIIVSYFSELYTLIFKHIIKIFQKSSAIINVSICS